MLQPIRRDQRKFAFDSKGLPSQGRKKQSSVSTHWMLLRQRSLCMCVDNQLINSETTIEN